MLKIGNMHSIMFTLYIIIIMTFISPQLLNPLRVRTKGEADKRVGREAIFIAIEETVGRLISNVHSGKEETVSIQFKALISADEMKSGFWVTYELQGN